MESRAFERSGGVGEREPRLRTHCRVIRVVTDGDGRARGVEYINAVGERHVQEADTVILCAYSYENVRLLLLSGGAKHEDGLGNNTGQVGKHFMTKQFPHVDGLFSDIVFNQHTGPAAQTTVLDDYLSDQFDSMANRTRIIRCNAEKWGAWFL